MFVAWYADTDILYEHRQLHMHDRNIKHVLCPANTDSWLSICVHIRSVFCACQRPERECVCIQRSFPPDYRPCSVCCRTAEQSYLLYDVRRLCGQCTHSCNLKSIIIHVIKIITIILLCEANWFFLCFWPEINTNRSANSMLINGLANYRLRISRTLHQQWTIWTRNLCPWIIIGFFIRTFTAGLP